MSNEYFPKNKAFENKDIEKLFTRITRYISGPNKENDLHKIEKAINFSLEMHKGQIRKTGEDYFNHISRVAINLVDRFQESDADVIVSALLHDVIEDQLTKFLKKMELDNMDNIDEVFAKVSQLFGERVATNLEALTNYEKTQNKANVVKEKMGKHKTYFYKVGESVVGNPDVLKIKLCDLLDNVIPQTEDQKSEYANFETAYLRMTKYAQMIPVFKGAIEYQFSSQYGPGEHKKDYENALDIILDIEEHINIVLPLLSKKAHEEKV